MNRDRRKFLASKLIEKLMHNRVDTRLSANEVL